MLGRLLVHGSGGPRELGNYGNTVDRWYRRAAVVIWPKDRAFLARAEAGSEWALRSLQERISRGDLDDARRDALSMEPFWDTVRTDLLPLALDVAAGLKYAPGARVLLLPIALETLTADQVPAVGLLQRTYGTAWVTELLADWAEPQRFTTGPLLTWISEMLVPFCQALRAEEQHELADTVVDLAWQSLETPIRTGRDEPRDETRHRRFAGLAIPVTRALEAADRGSGIEIAQELRPGGHTRPSCSCRPSGPTRGTR